MFGLSFIFPSSSRPLLVFLQCPCPLVRESFFRSLTTWIGNLPLLLSDPRCVLRSFLRSSVKVPSLFSLEGERTLFPTILLASLLFFSGSPDRTRQDLSYPLPAEGKVPLLFLVNPNSRTLWDISASPFSESASVEASVLLGNPLSFEKRFSSSDWVGFCPLLSFLWYLFSIFFLAGPPQVEETNTAANIFSQVVLFFPCPPRMEMFPVPSSKAISFFFFTITLIFPPPPVV